MLGGSNGAIDQMSSRLVESSHNPAVHRVLRDKAVQRR